MWNQIWLLLGWNENLEPEWTLTNKRMVLICLKVLQRKWKRSFDWHPVAQMQQTCKGILFIDILKDLLLPKKWLKVNTLYLWQLSQGCCLWCWNRLTLTRCFLSHWKRYRTGGRCYCWPWCWVPVRGLLFAVHGPERSMRFWSTRQVL